MGVLRIIKWKTRFPLQLFGSSTKEKDFKPKLDIISLNVNYLLHKVFQEGDKRRKKEMLSVI